MDPPALNRGLAPGGPGATGSSLVDWMLADPGLARLLLANLAPRDVLGLRAACRAAQEAVAAQPWFVQLPLRWMRVEGRSASDRGFVVTGARALRAWRACFPAALSLVVDVSARDGGDGDDDGNDDDDADDDVDFVDDDDAVTDAVVAAHCAGSVTHLALLGCAALTDACLAPLAAQLTAVELSRAPHLTGACIAPLTRLTRVAAGAVGDVTDAHLAPLARAEFVVVNWANAVTDAGLDEHLAADDGRCLRELELLVCDAGFTGAGLARFTRLEHVDLRGNTNGDVFPVLAQGCLTAAAAHLSSLVLISVGVSDDTLAALARLTHVTLESAPDVTDASFAHAAGLADLSVHDCAGFTGRLPPPAAASVRSLTVGGCSGFTGADWHPTPRLAKLAVYGGTAVSLAALAAVAAGSPRLADVVLDRSIEGGNASAAGITAALGAGWEVEAVGIRWHARRALA
jgi:hypothetical protein